MIIEPEFLPAERAIKRGERFGTAMARGYLTPALVASIILTETLDLLPEMEPERLVRGLIRHMRQAQLHAYAEDCQADADISHEIGWMISERRKLREIGEVALRVNAGRLPKETVRNIINRESAWWLRLIADAA